MHPALLLLCAALGLCTATTTLYRRQAFDPEETTGSGANCVEAFGPGYVECVPASSAAPRLCINPTLGEKCCNSLWGCPDGSFCLVQDLCCPDGLSPEACAAQNDVTLPPGFQVPSGSVPSGSSPNSTDIVPNDGPAITTRPSSGNFSATRTAGHGPVVTAGAGSVRGMGLGVVGAVVMGLVFGGL